MAVTAHVRMRGSRLTLRRRRTLGAYGFLVPALAIFLVFLLYPIVQAVRLSFYDYSPFDSSWIGLGNYRDLVHDQRFRNALGHTLYYAAATTALTVVLALVLALVLNAKLPFRSFSRSAVFLPFVLSLAIIAIAWSFLLDPDIGWVSYWLDRIGVPSVAWLRSPTWAMPAVIMVGVWKNVGYYMVMYLAGLQQIPADLYEAADVDGVSRWQRFRHITWPLLANTTMFVSILSLIASLQVFDQIYVMTSGGPYFKTETLVMIIYSTGFGDLKMGYASAIACVFTIIVVIVSLAQVAYFNRRAVRY